MKRASRLHSRIPVTTVRFWLIAHQNIRHRHSAYRIVRKKTAIPEKSEFLGFYWVPLIDGTDNVSDNCNRRSRAPGNDGTTPAAFPLWMAGLRASEYPGYRHRRIKCMTESSVTAQVTPIRGNLILSFLFNDDEIFE